MNWWKGKSSLVISVACCIFSAACLYKIMSLERQIDVMSSYINNRINSLQTDISSAASRMDEKLREESSLLAGTNYVFGEADYENGMVAMTYTAVPKEYVPGETKAELICNGTVYDMELKDGVYAAQVWVPLAKETKISSVQFHENGRVRTQAMDFYVNPRYDYLGTVYSDFFGGWTVKKGEISTELSLGGYVNIDVEFGKTGGQVKSIALVEYVDGEEKWSLDIPIKENTGQSSGITAETRAVPVSESGDSRKSYQYYLEQKYEVPFGSTFELMTKVTMENGLEYRNWIEREVFDETGEPSSEDKFWPGAEASIYDSKGNLVYDGLGER